MRGQVDRATDQSLRTPSWDAAASSSETIEAPTVKGPRKSRKRKRDGSRPGPVQKVPGDLEILYKSICCVNKILGAMTRGLKGSQDYAIEHLKSALRSSPEQAADILGSSMALAGFFFNDEHQATMRLGDLVNFHDPGNQREYAKQLVSVHEACISSIIDIWNSLCIAPDDSPDQSSYVRSLRRELRCCC